MIEYNKKIMISRVNVNEIPAIFIEDETRDSMLKLYIPTRQSTLHGVLVHDFRRYSARFPVISACGLFRYRYSGFC